MALPGIPAIPAPFGGNLVAAVAAGAAGGGFDAAYTSGSELNKAWGFIYNSGTHLVERPEREAGEALLPQV